MSELKGINVKVVPVPTQGNPYGLPGAWSWARAHIAPNGMLAKRPIPPGVTPIELNLDLYKRKLVQKDPKEDWFSKEPYAFDEKGYYELLSDKSVYEVRSGLDTSTLQANVSGRATTIAAVCRHYGSDIRILVRKVVDSRDPEAAFYMGFIGQYPTYGRIDVARDENDERFILFTPDEDCAERLFVCTALYSRLRCIPVNVDVNEVRWYIPFWYQHRATECEWLYLMFWRVFEPEAPKSKQRPNKAMPTSI